MADNASQGGSDGDRDAEDTGRALYDKDQMVNLREYGLQQWIRKEQFQQMKDSFSVFDRDGGQ